MLLFITGSYPNNQEGIADAAKIFLDEMLNFLSKENIRLLTTDTPIISDNIKENCRIDFDLMNNWHINNSNIRKLYKILKDNNVSAVHMDYPGDLYGKTFLASFIPFLVHQYNIKNHTNIKIFVRLHEFSRARFLRKLAIIPILLCADAIYVPAMKDREIVKKFAKKRVHRTYIGANITVVDDTVIVPGTKITISYFGSVYPGKGIEHMLNIWRKIKQEDSDNKYLFKIIGDIGTENTNHFADYHKQVWKWIEQYELKDCIEVTGYLSDKAVSKEIQNTQIATLLYEDGLTLRRGSFLAYLAHGIPIITSVGDDEAAALFKGHSGIAMTSDDAEIINTISKYSNLSLDERISIHDDNIRLSKNFDWEKITEGYLKENGLI